MGTTARPTTTRAAKGESRSVKAVPAAAGRSSGQSAERERFFLPLNPASIPADAEFAPPVVGANNHTQAEVTLAALPMVPLQRKLLVGPVTDPLEIEADTAARQVVRASRAGEERPQLQRGAGGSGSMSRDAPPIGQEVLRGPGQSLDAGTGQFMKPRRRRVPARAQRMRIAI